MNSRLWCVWIHRHGLIAARRQSIAIRSKNVKIGKKVPRDRVKDDPNFGGPAARAKKVHYNRCLRLRLLCGHYGSIWFDFGVVHKLSLVWATFWLINHVSGAPQHLEMLIPNLSVNFFIIVFQAQRQHARWRFQFFELIFSLVFMLKDV